MTGLICAIAFQCCFAVTSGFGFGVTTELCEISAPEYADLDWLYRCVEAEEGNVGYRAKYLAASCIVNRLSWGNYGDTFEDVIFYPMQFEVVRNGRIDRVIPTEETIKACDEALRNPATWVVGFSQGDKHSNWAEVEEVVNGEYFYRSKK